MIDSLVKTSPAENSLTKAEIARNVAQATGLTAQDAELALSALLQSLAEALVAGQRIEIRGFGTFETVLRAPRTGRNPRTGAKVNIPSRRVPVFRPGKRLKGIGSTDDEGH